METRQLIDGVLPWIKGLDEEKELMLLSALGGNPETDKISGGRIKILLVTEPHLMVESLLNGAKHWAKDASLEYFKYYKADPFMPLEEQMPDPFIRRNDVIHLTIDKSHNIEQQAINAFGYFEHFEDKPYPIAEELRRLKGLRPELRQRERLLIVEHYKELRKLEAKRKLCITITPKTVITLKNMAEAEAKLHERDKVEEEDVERAAILFSNTIKTFDDEKEEIDYLDEEKRAEWIRKKINEIYKAMKEMAFEGIITRERAKRLGMKIGLSIGEVEECLKILQENGYLNPEENDKVRVL